MRHNWRTCKGVWYQAEHVLLTIIQLNIDNILKVSQPFTADVVVLQVESNFLGVCRSLVGNRVLDGSFPQSA